MQKLFVSYAAFSLQHEVNDRLRQGWRVVPGTMGAHSTLVGVKPVSRAQQYETTFWVVLEKAGEGEGE